MYVTHPHQLLKTFKELAKDIYSKLLLKSLLFIEQMPDIAIIAEL